MKFNDVMPECFIDTTFVGILLDANVSHKHSCNEVAKEMVKGKYKDAFAVGIIDNDKRKLSYIEEFDEIGHTENLFLLKHSEKPHYIVKIGKEHKAMETFLQASVESIGMRMEDFDLPSDIDKLLEITKDNTSTQKDSRILNLCKAIRQSPEVKKLQHVLSYLVKNKYNADVDYLRCVING